MNTIRLRKGSSRPLKDTSTGMEQPRLEQFTLLDTPSFENLNAATREYLESHYIDIGLSHQVFLNMAELYGFPGTFNDFLTWSIDYLKATEDAGLQFEGLRSNQTELLPAVSFRIGGGINIQIQTGCRMADNSPDPIRPFDGLHVVKTDNSNMTEAQLESFRREINGHDVAKEFLRQFRPMNLHYVIRSEGSGWDDRLCYNLEFSVVRGKLTTYSKEERLELCRKSGAVLDKPGEVPGLERPLVGDLCAALLGLWISQSNFPLPRDGNADANGYIRQYIRSQEEVGTSLRPVSWWHVSRSLAHITAATRCAYALALGRAVAAVSKGSYIFTSQAPPSANDFVWNWKGAVSICFESLINVVALVVVIIMGKSTGFEIEWVAIMISLIAHLSTWVQLTAYKFTNLKLRSWKEAQGRIQRSRIIGMIVSGKLIATGSDGNWTLCEDGFDISGLKPTIKELEEAGAEVCGLTRTCSVLLFKDRVGILSKEVEMRESCYVKPAVTALRTMLISNLPERTVINNPD